MHTSSRRLERLTPAEDAGVAGAAGDERTGRASARARVSCIAAVSTALSNVAGPHGTPDGLSTTTMPAGAPPPLDAPRAAPSRPAPRGTAADARAHASRRPAPPPRPRAACAACPWRHSRTGRPPQTPPGLPRSCSAAKEEGRRGGTRADTGGSRCRSELRAAARRPHLSGTSPSCSGRRRSAAAKRRLHVLGARRQRVLGRRGVSQAARGTPRCCSRHRHCRCRRSHCRCCRRSRRRRHRTCRRQRAWPPVAAARRGPPPPQARRQARQARGRGTRGVWRAPAARLTAASAERGKNADSIAQLPAPHRAAAGATAARPRRRGAA